MNALSLIYFPPYDFNKEGNGEAIFSLLYRGGDDFLLRQRLNGYVSVFFFYYNYFIFGYKHLFAILRIITAVGSVSRYYL